MVWLFERKELIDYEGKKHLLELYKRRILNMNIIIIVWIK